MRASRFGSVLAAMTLSGAGCVSTVSVEGHNSSPWELGPSIRFTYPMSTRLQGTTFNPMASYTYLHYDGGHEDRFEAGAQVRRYSGRAGNPVSGFWFGAEAAAAVLRDNFTGGSESYTGGSLTALVGIPVSEGKRAIQIVGGAGWSYYGSAGKNVRLGIEFNPFDWK